MSPQDAEALGLETGEAASLTTRRGSVVVPVEVTNTMRQGHISLPNGMGLTGGDRSHGGVAPNDLPTPPTATHSSARHCTNSCPPASRKRRRPDPEDQRSRYHHDLNGRKAGATVAGRIHRAQTVFVGRAEGNIVHGVGSTGGVPATSATPGESALAATLDHT